jgi:hypothetical protein
VEFWEPGEYRQSIFGMPIERQVEECRCVNHEGAPPSLINEQTSRRRKKKPSPAGSMSAGWVGGDPLLGNGRQARQEVDNKD